MLFFFFQGNLPLHQAVKYEEESTVELLIDLGADLSAKNDEVSRLLSSRSVCNV